MALLKLGTSTTVMAAIPLNGIPHALVNDFRVNDEEEIHYTRYHLISEPGQKQFTHEEAVRMYGEDPDFPNEIFGKQLGQESIQLGKLCVKSRHPSKLLLWILTLSM